MTEFLNQPDLEYFTDSIQYLDADEDKLRAFRLVQKIIDYPYRISPRWLKENKFVAVPQPESMEEEESIRFIKIVNRNELKSVFGACIVTDNDSFQEKYAVTFEDFTPRAFYGYEKAFGPWHWLVFPELCQLVVLQVELGWHVVAGSKELVERVLDESVERALEKFHQHAAYYVNNYSEGFFAYLGEQLMEAYEYYLNANRTVIEILG